MSEAAIQAAYFPSFPAKRAGIDGRSVKDKTMKMPFVTRGRFDDERERRLALEAERVLLLNRIAELSGQPVLYREAGQPAASSEPGPASVSAKPAVIPHVPRRMTLAQVQAWGNDQAIRRSTPEMRAAGATSIVAELQLAEAKGRQMAVTTARAREEEEESIAG